MRHVLMALLLVLLLAGQAYTQSAVVRVLILDDTFQAIPDKDEKLERMGRMRGDLLISGTHYTGTIEVWKGRAGLFLINELPIEDYIKSVVGAEVGQNWDMEALKAQAVISRTYALYQKNANGRANYDLTSSVLHQVFKGGTPDARVSYAVMTTEGEVLTYDGKLIEALYHSTCGGMTEEPSEVFGRSYPYLRPVAATCSVSPYSLWERKIPIEEVEKALKLQGLQTLQIREHTVTGRVRSLEAVCADKSVTTIKATDLRRLLGWQRLPSTSFELSREEGFFVFDGKGYGHGVGLCQWSALEMARDGKTYREILSYFYPGTEIRPYAGR